MNLEISGPNTDVFPATRDYITRKLRKIERVAHHIERIEVRLHDEQQGFAVDLMLHADRTRMASRATGVNVRAAVDAAVGRIERQVVERHKKRIARRNNGRPGSADDAATSDEE